MRSSGLGRLLLCVTIASVGATTAACGDDASSADPEVFCERLERLATNSPFEVFGDVATPGQMQEAFEALRARAAELSEVAPERARPAAEEYLDAVDALDAILADASYSTAVDSQTYLEAQVDYTQAARRLERYLAAEC